MNISRWEIRKCSIFGGRVIDLPLQTLVDKLQFAQKKQGTPLRALRGSGMDLALLQQRIQEEGTHKQHHTQG